MNFPVKDNRKAPKVQTRASSDVGAKINFISDVHKIDAALLKKGLRIA